MEEKSIAKEEEMSRERTKKQNTVEEKYGVKKKR
jgi:hypothetical protein